MIRFMQSAFGRALRLLIGVLLVGYAAYLPVGLATAALIVGTAIAVMGVAGVCPLAAVFGGSAVTVAGTRSRV